MALDITSIFNRALDAIGARNNVSVPLERSREAEVCRLWYEPIRDQIFAAAAWPEATKIRTLALLAQQDDMQWSNGEPRPGYGFSYALPSDCLRPQYLTSGERFQIATRNDSERVLMTNASGAALVYTFRQEIVALWSPELIMGVTYGLAANICQPLTGKTSRTKMLIEQANNIIIGARETAANTSDEQLDSIPDWISARGFTDTSPRARFVFPFGSLLTVMTAHVN